MRPRVRIVLVTTLALALWWLVDGIRALTTGAYFGRVLRPTELSAHPTALRLPDGTYIDYGAWAAWLVELGVDPHALAPFFVALGLVGFFGLFLFLQARLVGWALLVAFAVVSMLKLGMITVLAGALLVVLVLPGTRALMDR